mmetsp:Transcript_114525/g.244314  ORF Transcript_114525/g.244314 Transcript_114525/m.244314 type:complete len:150 (-) Transcript_114525:220-669(-)
MTWPFDTCEVLETRTAQGHMAPATSSELCRLAPNATDATVLGRSSPNWKALSERVLLACLLRDFAAWDAVRRQISHPSCTNSSSTVKSKRGVSAKPKLQTRRIALVAEQDLAASSCNLSCGLKQTLASSWHLSGRFSSFLPGLQTRLPL